MSRKLGDFVQKAVLSAHRGEVIEVKASPDGQRLAVASSEKTVRVWSVSGSLERTITLVYVPTALSWAPTGRWLAIATADAVVEIWDAQGWRKKYSYTLGNAALSTMTWSPDGTMLACAEDIGASSITLLETTTGTSVPIGEHGDLVSSIAWSSDGETLASTSSGFLVLWPVKRHKDGTRRHPDILKHEGSTRHPRILAQPGRGSLVSIAGGSVITMLEPRRGASSVIEGHTVDVGYIAFTADGALMASWALDGTVRILNLDTWETTGIADAPFFDAEPLEMFFAAGRLQILTQDSAGHNFEIWELPSTPKAISPLDTVYYTNAKIVLVGDSGVGKSGLALVMTGEPFIPTESTHGRRVYLLDTQTETVSGRNQTREILLWDLAGQPGYRLIHQLHLNEVAVAIVVFDARSETDPFAGVRHWDRALRQAMRVTGAAAAAMSKYLVAARIDRGGIGVSNDRVDVLVRDLGFTRFVETSAKDGINIDVLREAIMASVPWDSMPLVVSTSLFQRIKQFLLDEKEAGHVLQTVETLLLNFARAAGIKHPAQDLVDKFETCIRRVESRGLIRQLSFGRYVLLQPELLDSYASALVNTAKDEPDGLGSIAEDTAKEGRFRIPEDERLSDKNTEKLLLIAMIEDLLAHEIALRETADDGAHLIFPSQLTREHPLLPEPESAALILEFEGPVMMVYSTLAVRLAHSGVFRKKALWRNAASYASGVRAECGMYVRELREGHGQLTVFFNDEAGPDIRAQFSEYIHAHLLRRSLPEAVTRRYIHRCPNCGLVATNQLLQMLERQGRDEYNCSGCNTVVSVKAEAAPASHSNTVGELDRSADAKRDSEKAVITLEGKRATGDFDVFIAYNSEHRDEVRQLNDALRKRGIYTWLDEEEMPAGSLHQDMVQSAIGRVKASAVVLGRKGLGRWEAVELRSLITQSVERNIPVIPVFLPGVDELPQDLLFLREFVAVRFRKSITEAEPLDALDRGIAAGRAARPGIRTHPRAG